jgi:hypothetical protein
LTDDVSTIEEIEQYHAKDYNWIYLQRPQHRGSEGFEDSFRVPDQPAQPFGGNSAAASATN